MTKAGDDKPNYAERLSANAEVAKDAWGSTLEDMERMADDLEDEGWETLTITAGDTAPESPDAGETDRFGLSYVVPKNDADRLAELLEEGTFSKYDVHRARAAAREYVVTTLLDPERRVAVLVAGNFELRMAPDCVRAAVENDEMYSHFQKLDGTHLGSVHHEDYEKFFPDPDTMIDWVTGHETA